MSNLIKVINLEKTFIDNSISKTILKNINFSLNYGEICGIIGESGCGKSTLAKLLCGIHTANCGSMLFESKPLLHIRKRTFNMCADIQYIFQDPYSSLESRYTVNRTILETIKLCKKHKRKYIEPCKAFSLVHMDFNNIKDKKISQLSGGQRQRVCIARALIPKPKLIIADECTSMLDKDTSKFIYDIFKNLNTSMNMSFILITHHKEAITELCSKILVIHKGTIVDCGTWKELNEKSQSNYTNEYINSMKFIEGF